LFTAVTPGICQDYSVRPLLVLSKPFALVTVTVRLNKILIAVARSFPVMNSKPCVTGLSFVLQVGHAMLMHMFIV
jgi:hypothetical protein